MRVSKVILHPSEAKAALMAGGKTEKQADTIVAHDAQIAGQVQADYDKAPPSIAYWAQPDPVKP